MADAGEAGSSKEQQNSLNLVYNSEMSDNDSVSDSEVKDTKENVIVTDPSVNPGSGSQSLLLTPPPSVGPGKR